MKYITIIFILLLQFAGCSVGPIRPILNEHGQPMTYPEYVRQKHLRGTAEVERARHEQQRLIDEQEMRNRQ